MNLNRKKSTTTIAVVGSLILAVILVFGTMWTSYHARKDTEESVRSVSLLYLDELAGRREQVVEENLQEKIHTIRVAIEMLKNEDIQDKAHLEAYQSSMKQLYKLDRFAFVDTDGLIYTSTGTEDNSAEYAFDYQTLSEPEISIFHLGQPDQRVIIAVPVHIPFLEKTLSVCFMAINMEEMLSGVSMKTNTRDATFCNLYTSSGTALTNSVLGGLAMEDNLLDAMRIATFEAPYSYDQFVQDFQSGERGVASFTYNGIRETLSYIPVNGTDWQLTYLIRESVISSRIQSISNRAIVRSVLQSILTIAIMLLLFSLIFSQSRKNARLLLAQETSEAENRVKREELERQLALQEQLLKEQSKREQQHRMFSALASDYRSVYYLELDQDRGMCYQQHSDLDEDGICVGGSFPYRATFTAYAEKYVTEANREAFLRFIDPANVLAHLKKQPVISFTYKIRRHGRKAYETVRFARVNSAGSQNEADMNHVGACFVDTDEETRKSMEQQQALSDALTAAQEASKAKTAFLSSMSHEIRTPMNAIIGLDNIALNDPELPASTREYLEKIGASADHLLELINDILDMSRIESGKLVLKNEEFSFLKLLEAINNMFSGQCQEKGLEYHCHVLSEVDSYYIGDNMKLRQVLINILGNAVKFTPSGGKVELLVERKNQFDGKSTLCFTIRDTGIGMSPEYLPHIFDTFSQEDATSTNKYGSSGLGMAITKSIVEMMNGRIQVESEKGVGSTFTVTVTLTDSERTKTDERDEDILPGELAVLIVDDDPVARRHAQLVLEKAGIHSETAESGIQALDMVRTRRARMEPYNLIILDWKMPEMDGVETAREIREAVGRESAIIILTAYRWDDVAEDAVQAGVDSFLPKPLFAAPVIEEYKSALKRKNLQAEQKHKTDLNGKTILLAEDIAVNAEIIQMLLQMKNMRGEHAKNGREAVEMFASKPEKYYDAILMDMRMPEMDGLEATRAIRALDRADAKSIPIIALTANAFDEDVQRSMQAGLNAHLSKPVQPETLFETLETLIRE